MIQRLNSYYIISFKENIYVSNADILKKIPYLNFIYNSNMHGFGVMNIYISRVYFRCFGCYQFEMFAIFNPFSTC